MGAAASTFNSETHRRGTVNCFHCGTPCRDERHSSGDKAFCCHGCLAVFELLSDSGLGIFYELADTAGVRVKATRADQFACLDEPIVRERLVNFQDESITRVTFHIPAIHCIACVWLLENLFRLKAGIGESQVNFPRKEVAITFQNASVKLSEVVSLLASLGYEPELKLSDLSEPRRPSVSRQLWLQLGVAGFAFGNLMLLAIGVYFGVDAFSGAVFRRMAGYFGLLLSIPVVTYSALYYWRTAWTSLKQRRLAIEVPIAAGIIAIFGQSAYEVLSGAGEGYFDSLCGLIFFLLCGRLFQQKTFDRLSFERDYQSFFPLSVTRLAADTTDEEHVALLQLRMGDVLVIRNGELIPADSRLLSGAACIDYSFVTGEAEPVEKNVGAHLYAGGRQTGAAIHVEMMKPVSQGYLTSLWNQHAFRKDKSATFETLINAYSYRFTFVVIAIATGAAVFWAFRDSSKALKAFTSVLIVACPCALALAAPFSLGTAIRALGRRDVFVKSTEVLEALAKVDAIVFDKTGTLTAAGAGAHLNFYASRICSHRNGFDADRNVEESTDARRVPFPLNGEKVAEGRMRGGNAQDSDWRDDANPVASVTTPHPALSPLRGEGAVTTRSFHVCPLSDDEQRWVCSLAGQSTHPLSVRIANSLRASFTEPVRSFTETPGGGIEGIVAGREILLGSAVWLKSRRVQAEFESIATRGQSVVYVAIDGEYRGYFVLESALRSQAADLIRALSQSYALALLSGDNEKHRDTFVGLFGERTGFNQSPLDKLEFIQDLQRRGHCVAMVGDGLNDAAALKQSNVGIAVVESISAFSPASDIIMGANMVPRLDAVLRFSKHSVRIVRLSFFLSSLYNVVGISIAASALLAPIVCAILMPLSSISVVAFACGATAWAARRDFRDTTDEQTSSSEHILNR